MGELGSANSLVIVVGLVAGKPMGNLLFCWLYNKLTKTGLPQNVRWIILFCIAILARVGVTMSIFISNLAFSDAKTIGYSKTALLLALLVATVLGLLILFIAKTSKKKGKGTNVLDGLT
jgi:NhaA family Na+:H+ antiporter